MKVADINDIRATDEIRTDGQMGSVPLVNHPVHLRSTELPSVVIGHLIALKDDGNTPLITYDGQPGTSALRAQATVDLVAHHIGSRIALMFVDGDPQRPIVTGVLRGNRSCRLDAPAHVEVESDDERVIVSAKRQLVLRCGSASLTLTSEGKVLIRGTFVHTHSSGVNRIVGGSVQIN